MSNTRELVQRAAMVGHVLCLRGTRSKFYAACTCGHETAVSRSPINAMNRATRHLVDVLGRPRSGFPAQSRYGD